MGIARDDPSADQNDFRGGGEDQIMKQAAQRMNDTVPSGIVWGQGLSSTPGPGQQGGSGCQALDAISMIGAGPGPGVVRKPGDAEMAGLGMPDPARDHS